ALDIRIFADLINKGVIFLQWYFFGDQRFERLFFLDADRPPETEDLLAYLFLETIGKSKRDDHDCHTDHRGHDRQPDNKPGKRSLLIKCDPVCNKTCNLQNEMFVLTSKIS